MKLYHYQEFGPDGEIEWQDPACSLYHLCNSLDVACDDDVARFDAIAMLDVGASIEWQYPHYRHGKCKSVVTRIK